MSEKAETVPAIYGALARIMGAVPVIGKGQNNQQQGFKYRGIDDIYNAFHAAMVREGVFCVPRVLERTVELRKTRSGGDLYNVVAKVEYLFTCAKDASVLVVGPLYGEGSDSGDKATNKALAIAHKYCFIQAFAIPTNEPLDDPDSVTPPETIQAASAEQLAAISKGLAAVGADDEDGVLARLKPYNVQSTSELNREQAEALVKALRAEYRKAHKQGDRLAEEAK